LEPGAGTGSSAAFVVALTAAFTKLFGHDFLVEKTERMAWKVCNN